MKKGFIIFITGVALWLPGIFSQEASVYNLLMDPGELEYGATLLDLDNGNILLIGSNGYINANAIGLILYEIHPSGCIDQEYNLQFTEDNIGLHIWDIIHTSDGGYAMCGKIWISEDVREQGLLVKLNSDFSINWWQIYGQYAAEGFYTLIECSDGYITGGLSKSQAWGLDKSYLIKSDLNGVATDSLFYDIENDAYNGINDVHYVNDSIIYVLVAELFDGTGTDFETYSKVMKINSELEILDEEIYFMDNVNGFDIFEQNNMLIMSGTYYIGDIEDLFLNCLFTKYDMTTNSIEWQLDLHINQKSSTPEDFCILSNGDIITGGWTVLDSMLLVFQHKYVGWVAKISPDGELKWLKEIKSPSDELRDFLMDISIGPNDEIYIGGHSETEDVVEINGQLWVDVDMWYLRMDTAGNIYKPLSLHHSFIDDTLTINQPYFLPPYQAINGSPCYDYIWVVEDPDGFALSGPGEDNIFTPTKPGRYRFTLIVQDEGGEQVSTQFELWVEPLTGFEAIDGGDMGLLSITNPAGDRLWVYNGSTEAYTLTLYDLTGREIAQLANIGYGSHSYDSSGWPSGTYLLSITDASGRRVAVKKCVKL